MKELGISKFVSQYDIDKLLERVNNAIDKIAKFNSIDNKEIKDRLLSKEQNDISKYIIYGDYKYKNENVEVFLHQRTMKKVKYRKREYDSVHPINSQTINNVRNRIYDELIDVEVNDRLIREMNRIKNII
jgi:hypothetical protein